MPNIGQEVGEFLQAFTTIGGELVILRLCWKRLWNFRTRCTMLLRKRLCTAIQKKNAVMKDMISDVMHLLIYSLSTS